MTDNAPAESIVERPAHHTHWGGLGRWARGRLATIRPARLPGSGDRSAQQSESPSPRSLPIGNTTETVSRDSRVAVPTIRTCGTTYADDRRQQQRRLRVSRPEGAAVDMPYRRVLRQRDGFKVGRRHRRLQFYDRHKWPTRVEAKHAVANWIESRVRPSAFPLRA